jgi:hypothetical protein
MKKRFPWLEILGGLALVGDFIVLMNYGYALRSTNLFIARSTVFYPLAWLNLVLGVALLAYAVMIVIRSRRT